MQMMFGRKTGFPTAVYLSQEIHAWAHSEHTPLHISGN